MSTGDESKENLPAGCRPERSTPENCTETESPLNNHVPTTEPLSINCDLVQSKPEQVTTPR